MPRDARGAGDAAGRRAEDRQRRAQRRLRRADHRGRHPRLPRRQPHRAGAGRDAARGRGGARADRARRIPAPRPPLADPARPLRLHRAQAALPGVPDRRLCRYPDKTPPEAVAANVARRRSPL